MYPGSAVAIAHGMPKERDILIYTANSSKAEHLSVLHCPWPVRELSIKV